MAAADEQKITSLDDAVSEQKNTSHIYLVSKSVICFDHLLSQLMQTGTRFEVKNRQWVCVSHVLQNALDGGRNRHYQASFHPFQQNRTPQISNLIAATISSPWF